jgi:hypothetical protein
LRAGEEEQDRGGQRQLAREVLRAAGDRARGQRGRRREARIDRETIRGCGGTTRGPQRGADGRPAGGRHPQATRGRARSKVARVPAAGETATPHRGDGDAAQPGQRQQLG